MAIFPKVSHERPQLELAIGAELVSVGGARLLLRAYRHKGIVHVEKHEYASAMVLVGRGQLVLTPWVRDPHFGELLEFTRYSLTTRGRRLARQLAKDEKGGDDAAARAVLRWRGLGATKVCPGCGCMAPKPCQFELPDGGGTGECVPAGVYDLPKCSRCLAGAPRLPPPSPSQPERPTDDPEHRPAPV